MISLDDYLKIKQVEESFQLDRNAASRNLGKRTRTEEIEWGKDSAFNFKFVHQGVAFVPSIHSASQAKDRRPDLSESDWKKLHRKAYWYIHDNNVKHGVFLFYSKELQQGYIAQVRPSRGTDGVSASKVVAVITVLPKGKHNPMGGNNPGQTELAMMEEIQLAFADQGILFESIETIKVIIF